MLNLYKKLAAFENVFVFVVASLNTFSVECDKLQLEHEIVGDAASKRIVYPHRSHGAVIIVVVVVVFSPSLFRTPPRAHKRTDTNKTPNSLLSFRVTPKKKNFEEEEEEEANARRSQEEEEKVRVPFIVHMHSHFFEKGHNNKKSRKVE